MKPDLVETFDFEQGGPEWFEARRGLVTASRMGDVLAGSSATDSATRTKYLRLLAGEILSGVPMETYSNADMDRGKAMEPLAIEHYSFTRGVEIQKVGFVRRTICDALAPDLVIGASPDGLIGEDETLEIKTMRPDLMVAFVAGDNRFPIEHVAQCQGTLWATGRKVANLMIYYRGMPFAPRFRLVRDEAYISRLRDEVGTFYHDLGKLVAKVKSKGTRW